MNIHTRRLALLGLAIGVLLALVVAPQTRWLVRLQALTSLNLYHPLPPAMPEMTSVYTTSGVGDDRLRRRAVGRHPDDFGRQYAYAVFKPSSQEVLAGLRALLTRFPNEPSLYAGILRQETRGNVHLSRAEDYQGGPLPPGYKPAPPPTPDAQAAFDREAALGERVDPDNAFFPMMRAVGLFAAHRDVEGLGAVHRAAQKTHWREYVSEDVHAQWRLHADAFGDPGAMGRASLFADILFPHYQGLRAVARVAVYKAILAERAGRSDQGRAIRRDLMRCGDLMRDGSSTYIGSLVAVAITYIARAQPGGLAGPYKNDPKLTPEQNAQKRLDLYCAYARRTGHPEDAEAARADFAVGERIQALEQTGIFQRLVTEGTRLLFWWLAGLATLANLFWLLALGGLTSALARTRWARESGESAGERAPVDRKVAFKQRLVAVAVLTAVLLLADRFLHFLGLTDWLGAVAGFGGSLLVVLLVFGLPPTVAVYVMRHGVRWPRFSRPTFTRRDASRKLLALLIAALAVATVYALVCRQAEGMQSLIQGWNGLIPSDDGSTSGVSTATGLTPSDQVLFGCAFASLALPLLVALVFAITSRLRGVPVSAGLVRGFRLAALPLACGLLLAFGGLTLGTVRQEGAVGAAQERMVNAEGAYLAEQAGQPWPVSAR